MVHEGNLDAAQSTARPLDLSLSLKNGATASLVTHKRRWSFLSNDKRRLCIWIGSSVNRADAMPGHHAWRAYDYSDPKPQHHTSGRSWVHAYWGASQSGANDQTCGRPEHDYAARLAVNSAGRALETSPSSSSCWRFYPEMAENVRLSCLIDNDGTDSGISRPPCCCKRRYLNASNSLP